MKSEDAPLASAIYLGLLILFTTVWLVVWVMAPPEKTPREKQEILVDNLSALYFIDGETMAKKFHPDPTLRWSRDGLDDGSDCKAIGGGIWHAYGTIAVESERSIELFPWQVFFRPPDATPIYIQVADQESGDKAFALQKESDFEALTQKSPP